MYCFPSINYDYFYRNSSQELIGILKRSIQDERNDVDLYEKIHNIAYSQDDKIIINTVVRDEKEHVETFRTILREITGEDFYPSITKVAAPTSYIEGIRKGILAEIDAIESYNELFIKIPIQKYKNLLIKIINDELKHLGEFNYLYTKNMI